MTNASTSQALAPSMTHVTGKDLHDDERLAALYADAVARGLWPNSGAAALVFAGLAQKALGDDTQGTPEILFAALVRARDTSKISDAAERAAMARWPSTYRHELVATVNATLNPEAHNQQLATKGDVDEALAVPQIGYSHAVLMQCFLPQRRIKAREWTATHGRATLGIDAGRLAHPGAPGMLIAHDVPSGPKARIIAPYIIGEAIRNASPHVDLGRSLRAFMARLGVPVAGTNGNALVAQIQNIAAATIIIGEWRPDRVRTLGGRIADEYSFWIERSPDQQTFWTPTMTLSERFYAAIQTHRVPVNMEHLVQLGRSPRRMDLYSWLSYRTPNIPTNDRHAIAVAALHHIFGPDIARLQDFKARLRRDLAAIAQIHAAFRMELADDILWLKRSPPPVRFGRLIHSVPERTV